MTDRSPLSDPVLTCPGRSQDPALRILTLAGASLLHILILVIPLLVPILIVEMMRGPEATIPTTDPPITQPRIGLVSAQAGRVRAGRPAAPSPRRPEPPRPVPLKEPAPNPSFEGGVADMTGTDMFPDSIGEGSGPGIPGGTGSDFSGTLEGCPGCAGGGPDGPPGAGTGSRIYEWSPNVVPPEMILSSRVMPEYPRAARLARVDGSVMLLAAVRTDGSIGEIEVLRAPDPRFGFEFAAIEAVKQWRYRPGSMNGQPIAVYVRIIVEFTIAR